MIAKHLIISILITNSVFASSEPSEKKYSQQEYVSMWKECAIKQMNLHKIPASITLAQGILESGNGNSELAKNANNHFGIKCSDWKGDTYHKEGSGNDQGDCFRKYSDAQQSYEDHSLFLTSRTRYSSLFNLPMTDYKAWAKGLKEAGYAVSVKYPDLLIEIIERLKLNELDNGGLTTSNKTEVEIPSKPQVTKTDKVIMANTHTVQTHKNNIKYIVAKKGDTYYRISKEFQIGMWQLYRYNEFGEKKDYLVEGDIIYLAPKKRKSKSNETYQAKHDLSLRIISQAEGIKVQRLMKMNNISSPDEIIKKGQSIALK